MYRILALAFGLLLSGCVANVPLTRQTPELDYAADGPVVVAVIDDRKRVREGKPRTFIGRAHGAFGIPFDWHVHPAISVEPGDKDRDLAQLLRHRLVAGMSAAGWSAIEAPDSTALDPAGAQKLLEQLGASRLLKITLEEWFFSINLNWVTAFNFDTDVLVSVYQDGQVASLEKRIAGRDVIDVESDQSPRNHILLAYRDQLSEIVSDKDVQAALGKDR